MHVLQTVIWPSASTLDAPEALYMRAEPRGVWTLASGGGIKAGPTPVGHAFSLSLHTFFGAFSLSTWCHEAELDSVVLEIECRGRATLEIYEDNGFDGRILVMQRRIVGDGKKQYIERRGLKGKRGILFPVFVLTAADRMDVMSVRYLTREPPRNPSKVAIVMPTYKRERDVTQNIARIATGVLDDHPECKLFVIDNGESLKMPKRPGVEVVPNPNYGGAGGFARGLLELKKEKEEPFTHVVFCDDDVLVNAEAILRVIALTSYVNSNTVVSGAMLKMDSKHTHVRAAEVAGIGFYSVQRTFDMTDPKTVACYDQRGFTSFSGWWLACYPLTDKLEDFMPMPFFIGWDDIEMGRRVNRLGMRTVSLLGFGIWHEDFDKKETAWRWYYHARNGCATAMLHEDGRLALKQIRGEIFRNMLTYRYDRAQFMLDGLDWLAAGPKKLRDARPDLLHKELITRPQVGLADVSKILVPDRFERGRGDPGRLHKWSRRTFNGHLVPIWFFRSAREPSYPGWAVEGLHSHAMDRIFLNRRVIYYESATGKGLDCGVDHGRFWKLFLRLSVRWLTLRLSWRRVRDSWRAEEKEMTSPAFWREYLKLPKE